MEPALDLNAGCPAGDTIEPDLDLKAGCPAGDTIEPDLDLKAGCPVNSPEELDLLLTDLMRDLSVSAGLSPIPDEGAELVRRIAKPSGRGCSETTEVREFTGTESRIVGKMEDLLRPASSSIAGRAP